MEKYIVRKACLCSVPIVHVRTFFGTNLECHTFFSWIRAGALRPAHAEGGKADRLGRRRPPRHDRLQHADERPAPLRRGLQRGNCVASWHGRDLRVARIGGRPDHVRSTALQQQQIETPIPHCQICLASQRKRGTDQREVLNKRV